MTKLLPFDLEAAKAGAKVLFCRELHGRMTDDEFLPVDFVGLVDGVLPVIYDRKTTRVEVIASPEFLRMAPTPVKRWRVIYRGADDNAAQMDFEQYKDASKFWCENDFSAKPFEVEVTP